MPLQLLQPAEQLLPPINSINEQKVDNYRRLPYSKQLSRLKKKLTEEMKYGGRSDPFDLKFDNFINIAGDVDVPEEALPKAFRAMLKHEALNFYNANQLFFANMSLKELIRAFKMNFEGNEYEINALHEWNHTSLPSVMASNKDKSLRDCIDILAQKLRTLQYGLSNDLRSENFIYQKLITACETVPACGLVCRRPPATLQPLLHALRTSTSYQDRVSPAAAAETMYTDRRYRSRDQRRYPSRSRQNRDRDHRDHRDQRRYDKKKKYCYVCGKEGCWSKLHPKEECDRATRQYILDIEGSNDDDDDDDKDTDIDEYIDRDPPKPDDNIAKAGIDRDESFTTSMGTIDGKAAYYQLVHQATFHAVAKAPFARKLKIDTFGQIAAGAATPSGYTAAQFHGIMIDTGAAHNSSAGFNQYLALQREQNIAIDTSIAGTARFKFGIGEALSKGVITVRCPIGDIRFHVVDADTPFLLCLEDLDRTGFYFNNLKNCLMGKGKRIPITRLHGHPFLTWGSSYTNLCVGAYVDENGNADGLLTDEELRRLHRRFGHPSAGRLARLLRQSGHDYNRAAIDQLTKFCSTCQKHGKAPGRFKFTIKNDLQFNHSVIIDIMYLDSPAMPVLHLVDEATRFQNARFLKDISAETVWDTLRACWIDTYVGPPDMLIHDAGKQFTSAEFSSKAKAMSIEVKCVPVEAHHSIGMVERYHAPLRRAYEIIREELPSLHKAFALQMAIKAVNDTAGPDGLTPTLLLFGTFPRMVDTDPTHPSIAERSKVIKKAMKEVSEIIANRAVNEALRQRNGPQIDAILDTPVGRKMLVWRENKGWKGPYQLLAIQGHTCMLKLESGPTPFRVTSVKPYNEEDPATLEEEDLATPIPPPRDPPEGTTTPDQAAATPPADTATPDEAAGDNISADSEADEASLRRNPRRQQRLPARYANITAKELSNIELSNKLRAEGIIRAPNGPFIDSRKKEITGLINEGVFKIVSKGDIPANTRIFGCRFVDEIKYKDDIPFEKSRLVVQAHHDDGKKEVLTQSPTIQRVSQRLIICIATVLPRPLAVRDISQAYVQSTSKLNRTIYVRPPPGTDLGDNLLQVIRPLYGIPEAGTHWFRTYHAHHTEKLHLTVSSFDPCLMFSKMAVVGLQTDDSLFSAIPAYFDLEEKERLAANFPAKPVVILQNGKDLPFNGAVISQQDEILKLSQPKQCSKIALIDTAGDIKTQYIKERARGAYIASMCQPEAAFALSKAAQIVNPSKEAAIWLNKCLKWQKDNDRRGLNFVKLAPERLKLLVFVDAAFANNDDMSSQIGYIVLLANEERMNESNIDVRGNIIHWSSTKCKRVTRSVLASELYAMVAGFDIAVALQSTVNGVFQAKVPLILCTDSYSLYDCIIRLGTTAEKRLMIDIMGLRQSYENREINEVRWIDGSCNPADAMTKERPC